MREGTVRYSASATDRSWWGRRHATVRAARSEAERRGSGRYEISEYRYNGLYWKGTLVVRPFVVEAEVT